MSPVHTDVDGIRCLTLRALCHSACSGSARCVNPAYFCPDHAHTSGRAELSFTVSGKTAEKTKQTQVSNEIAQPNISTRKDVDEDKDLAASDDNGYC